MFLEQVCRSNKRATPVLGEPGREHFAALSGFQIRPRVPPKSRALLSASEPAAGLIQ
jgi:hypothetical protein